MAGHGLLSGHGSVAAGHGSMKVIASDNVVFTIDIKIAKAIPILKSAVHKHDSNNPPTSLPASISSQIFSKVLEWVSRHRNEIVHTAALVPLPVLTGVRCSDITDRWDVEYLKVDQTTLFQIVLAAHHLGCKKLVDLCCKSIAGNIRGKTPREIQSTFNIRDDWKPNELSSFWRRNQWLNGATYVNSKQNIASDSTEKI